MDKTISSRFLAQKELFDSHGYFKLICGAGNEDLEEVRRLSMIYTLSGATGMDISATPSVVKACLEGIDRAYEISHKLKKEIKIRPFIMISVGMPGDHHVRKALIDPDLCIMCGLCVDPVCPTDAIEWGGAKTLAVVNQPQCIGCGDCSAICPKPEVISYVHNGKGLEEILPECIELGAENIELHAAVADDEVIMK